MADSKELAFQQDIINDLAAQGWLVGTAAGYNPTTALYTEDLVAYFQTAWPDRWQKLCKANPSDPAGVLIQKTVRALEHSGTLDVLRHGYKLPGVKVELCSFKPDHAMNPDTQARYQANRLRVVPEVSYSPHAHKGADASTSYNPRLDLVLFVNGIPTATLELKSEFKQSIENAKRQYRDDRPVKDPLTRKAEPLLTFKRGALVHFAVSQQDVAMTTKLAGQETFFLPFNQGTVEGGSGNPPAADEAAYATGYLWQQLFQPDAWLKVLGRFLHLEQKTIEHFDGTRTPKETLIFPRYHQWQVVNQLIDTTHREGAGQRYLIQHSAGSGKSNSIAWTAHQLAAMYDDTGNKLFSSVIVITDRTVLDSQLQDTIYQFEHAQGVVVRITRDGTSQSKSEQLAEALAAQTRIIIVTIQTFPALFDALDKYPALASGRYAVIADEAHSSQTGSAASKLKAILGSDQPEQEEISAEELLDAAVQARRPNDRISYYAFTATPKARTLELFGRPPNPDLPASADNKPEPFHVYSMRQAIEEGFILDVLLNYTTYSTAWKIAHPNGEDEEVDSKKARTKLARWVRLHPYNISQKVEVIVEHFREHVRHLLNGQAKAMVVTSSRQEAVRYQLALKAYVTEKGYTDVHPLVAFSGSVPPDDVIPEEVTETSSRLNPGLNGRDLAKAFDTADYNVMIAANKFQTGFDQPKLCAMYVDKKLHGVDCVQTLSRLNRTFPGKETFILDFFNEPQDILEAFLPYYNKAELADVSDPQIIYDLQTTLDAEGIYHWQEVEAFALAFFDPKAAHARLTNACKPAVDRFKQRYKLAEATRRQALTQKQLAETNGNSAGLKQAEHELKAAGEQIDHLDLFKKNLQSFVRLYEFLSQIVDYDDRELEQLCVYAKHLHPLLRRDRLDQEDVDISELSLTHYRLTKRAEQQLRLAEEGGEYPLKPGSDIGSGKPHDPEKKRLSEIIHALNDLFGAEVSDDDQVQFLNTIAQRIRRQDDVMAQVNNHTAEQVMHGLFPKRVIDTVLDAMTDHEKLSLEVLDNEESGRRFALLVLKILTSAKGTLGKGLGADEQAVGQNWPRSQSASVAAPSATICLGLEATQDRSEPDGLEASRLSTVELASVSEGTQELSTRDRLHLIQTINALPPTQFDELAFALNPPKGVVASNAAAQGVRSKDLLDWLEGSSGPGLAVVNEVLQGLIPKATKTAPEPVAFVISGRISSSTTAELHAFVELLRKKTGDNSIDVAFFREGSIKAVLTGSQEGLATLRDLFISGELADLDTLPIEAIHRVNGNSTDARKARLIQALRLSTCFHDRNNDIIRIHNLAIDLYDSPLPRAHDLVVDLAIVLDSYISRNLYPAFNLGLASFLTRARDLARDTSNENFLPQAHNLAHDLINVLATIHYSGLDLRDADLSGANLRNMNLWRAEMSGANLNHADVTNTIFGNNSGFTEAEKHNLQNRGAIFLDPPSSDIPSLALR